MTKLLCAVFALVLALATYRVATGSMRSFLDLDRPTQGLILVSMIGVAVVLWIRLMIVWRRRAAATPGH